MFKGLITGLMDKHCAARMQAVPEISRIWQEGLSHEDHSQNSAVTFLSSVLPIKENGQISISNLTSDICQNCLPQQPEIKWALFPYIYWDISINNTCSNCELQRMSNQAALIQATVVGICNTSYFGDQLLWTKLPKETTISKCWVDSHCPYCLG